MLKSTSMSSDTRANVQDNDNKVTHLVSMKTGQPLIIPEKDRVGTHQNVMHQTGITHLFACPCSSFIGIAISLI